MITQSVPLNEVLITEQLAARPARIFDDKAMNRALLRLTLKMAENPAQVLQNIVATAAQLTRAHSSGASILAETEEGNRFQWRAVTGRWAKYLGGSMPREASPCGTILDRNIPMLMTRPQLHYEAMRIADPPIEEVILTPFYDGTSNPIGTLWIIAHDESLQFDSTDVTMLNELAKFTTSAYNQLRFLGYFPQ